MTNFKPNKPFDIWDVLRDYGRIEWKWTLKDLGESPGRDILNKYNLTWGWRSKALL